MAPCANTQFVPPTNLFMECLNRVLCIQQSYTIPQLATLEEKKTHLANNKIFILSMLN